MCACVQRVNFDHDPDHHHDPDHVQCSSIIATNILRQWMVARERIDELVQQDALYLVRCHQNIPDICPFILH